MNEEQTSKTPLEDLRQSALKEYENLADRNHCWSNSIPMAINFYYDHLIASENGIPVENPEWTEIRIKEKVRAEAEMKEKIAEMNKQIEYSEKITLRQLKLDAFRLASGLKPSNYNSLGQSVQTYSAKDLIKDAEAIYQSLIKE